MKTKSPTGACFKRNKRRLFREEKFCHYCRTELTVFNRSVDHVIPISKGGTGNRSNLVASCKFCNWMKGDSTRTKWSRRFGGFYE